MRVYARSAMGMPGSETALEKLLCRVFGDLLEEGVVAKLADDIYCGGNTIAELQRNVRRLLQCFADSGLAAIIGHKNNYMSNENYDSGVGVESRHYSS